MDLDTIEVACYRVGVNQLKIDWNNNGEWGWEINSKTSWIVSVIVAVSLSEAGAGALAVAVSETIAETVVA